MTQTAKKQFYIDWNERDFPVIMFSESDNERRIELPKLNFVFDSYALIDYLNANYPDCECTEIRWKKTQKDAA